MIDEDLKYDQERQERVDDYMESLTKSVIDVVSYSYDLDPEYVFPKSLVRDVSDIGSLDHVELKLKLENKFDITMSDDDYFNCETVIDLVNLISRVKNE
jgi:acyl carrier protein